MKRIIVILILTVIPNLSPMKKITTKFSKIKLPKFDKKRPNSKKGWFSVFEKYKANDFFKNVIPAKKLLLLNKATSPLLLEKPAPLLQLNRPFGLTQQSDNSFKFDERTKAEAQVNLLKNSDREFFCYSQEIAKTLLQMMKPNKAIDTLKSLFCSINATHTALMRGLDRLHYQLYNNLLAQDAVWYMVGKTLTLDPIGEIIQEHGPVAALLAGIGNSGKRSVIKFAKFMDETIEKLEKEDKTEYEIQQILTKLIADSKIVESATLNNDENLLYTIEINTDENGQFNFDHHPWCVSSDKEVEELKQYHCDSQLNSETFSVY